MSLTIGKVDLREYYNLPNPGLLSHMAMLREGYREDIRTPFWSVEGVPAPRSSVVDSWRRVLLSSNLGSEFPQLLEYEFEQAKKIGPSSVSAPLSRRMDTIKEYWYAIESASHAILPEAINAFCDEKCSGIRITDLRRQDDTWLKMKKGTASGSPFWAKRSSVVDKTLPVEIQDGLQVLDGNPWPIAFTCSTRVQSGGPAPQDAKTRVIWAAPMGLNVVEAQWYQPLIEQLQRHNSIAALVSMDEVDRKITSLFQSKDEKDLCICTDFKAFDQHFNPDLQQAARESYRILGCPEGWIENVYGCKFAAPLIADEYIFEGPHGMASGSGGTNTDEDFAHGSMQYEAAMLSGQELNPFSEGYGDDGYLSYPGITVKDICQIYESHGQVMNPEKQYAAVDCAIYLRRIHHVEYTVDGVMVGVYPTMRALNSLLGQERYYDPEKWNSRMVILRALSILENCKWHPLFHKFVDFVQKGDKYQLGVSVPGFFDNISGLAQEAEDALGDDFLGYTKMQMAKRVGIADWEVVKYLRSQVKS